MAVLQVEHVAELVAGDGLGKAEQQRELVHRELGDLGGAVAAVGPGLLRAGQDLAVGVEAPLDGVAVVEHRPLPDEQQATGTGRAFPGDLGDQRVSTLLTAQRLGQSPLHDPNLEATADGFAKQA